ncbi:SMI1/KNR4 family protein [Brenneria sp. 4F2]|nr:SMI1/KNR4 family protein [Brenneria bubanii]
MDIYKVIEKLKSIENRLGKKLPNAYKKFLSEEVGSKECYEINNGGCVVYIYNVLDLIERNQTYAIQNVEPDYLLIGQDGDLGYFICLGDNDDKIYSLDLGALGSLELDEEAKDLYSLGAGSGCS